MSVPAIVGPCGHVLRWKRDGRTLQLDRVDGRTWTAVALLDPADLGVRPGEPLTEWHLKAAVTIAPVCRALPPERPSEAA